MRDSEPAVAVLPRGATYASVLFLFAAWVSFELYQTLFGKRDSLYQILFDKRKGLTVKDMTISYNTHSPIAASVDQDQLQHSYV